MRVDDDNASNIIGPCVMTTMSDIWCSVLPLFSEEHLSLSLSITNKEHVSLIWKQQSTTNRHVGQLMQHVGTLIYTKCDQTIVSPYIAPPPLPIRECFAAILKALRTASRELYIGDCKCCGPLHVYAADDTVLHRSIA